MVDDKSNIEGHASFRRAPSKIPRMVKRDLVFEQSSNIIAMRHGQGFFGLFWLLRHDWFHALLRFPTLHSLGCLLLIWTLMIILFAGIYMGVDRRNPELSCGLGTAGDPIQFGAAFAFSLETCTTVGYGLPSGTNAFFESCRGLQAMIYCQMVWSMLFNAFLFAFAYSRIGRSESRASQVLMASKAIVSMIHGKIRFQIRIVDVDAKYPVVEAHCRLYVLMRSRPVPRPLRLVDPDDDLGSFTLLSFPTVISHEIDLYSLLHPPTKHGKPMRISGPMLRQADSMVGSRDDVVCPICGETYGTHSRWLAHVRYNKLVEEQEEYPVENSHLSLTEEDLKPEKHEPIKNMYSLREHFRNEVSEVICVVEGIDPLMSGTFQALQSYTFEDIIWDEAARYTPCLQVNGDGDHLVIDLEKFHQTELPSESTRANVGPHDAQLVK